MHNVSSSNQVTRTSWSSLETSDSSGIGSYISLNSHGRPNQDKSTGYHSDGEYEGSDELQDYDYDEEFNMQMANLNTGPVQMPQNFQANFRRNTDVTSSMRGTRSSGAPYRRSNSLTEGEPLMMDYRMNMPGRRSNTVHAKHTPTGAKPTAFQALSSGQTPAQLRSQLSPTGSPLKNVRPPTRKVSSPPSLYGGGAQQKSSNYPSRASVSGIAENNHCFETNNSTGIYATPNISGTVSTSMGDHNPYATRSAAFQAHNNPAVIDRNANHNNDYAVPTTQPLQADPNSPVDFPPPPPALQMQEERFSFSQQQPYQGHVPPQKNASQYQVLEQLRKQQQQQLQDSNFHNSHYQQPMLASQGQASLNYQQQQQQQQILTQQQQQSYHAQQQQQHFPSQQQQFPSQQQQQHQQYQVQQQYQTRQQQPQYQGQQQPQQLQYQYQQAPLQWSHPQQSLARGDSHSADDDMPDANPGSFLDEIQQKRTLVRSRTLSAGSNRSQPYGN